ncbi:ABC transporter substrate-binding protein [candidate division KSB3 bacterium]|uniref:ABC transporter substrate-binding protein n=1 Tax=candidate division KSB3 bacterium TaxID=2044937 RepID=A0A9D5Q4X0_9BACT|nr:ABC transporter substrate-binding protein [candidate division KSB3 bacterium]MBD3323637.1 ABC transporter substrate-binding protein [candidate division KSB3 bacterium]
MRKLLLNTIIVLTLCFMLVQPAAAKTLKMAYAGDVRSMDPYANAESFTLAFLGHVYEPLVRYNRDLTIEPALATSWDVIEPTVWRFKLREGVKYHNGNPFDADDVVASIKRVTHSNSPLKGNVPAVKDIRKVDQYTVDFILNGTYPLLLNDLSNIYMMDAEWMTEHNCLNPTDPAKGEESYATINTNGTGPFLVESRQPDAKTVLVVNPDWWDHPQHNLTRIDFTPIQSDATRVAALLSGEIDFMYPSPLQDAQRLNNTPGIKVLEGPGLRTIMLMLNQKPDTLHNSNIEGANPLRELGVRKALYQAINMDLIQQKIMRGKSRNAGLLVAPEIPGFDPELNDRYPYDPEAAQNLLVEAGYPDGFEVGFDCPNDRYINDEEICQAITSMWAKIGVKANLTAQTKSLHFNKALAGECDIWMLGWATLPMMDSYSVLSQMLSSSREQLGLYNPGGYKNPRVDELVDKIAVELDASERQKMISEAFKLAKEDVPIIPLHQQPLSWAVREGVNVIQFADDKIRLWYATID